MSILPHLSRWQDPLPHLIYWILLQRPKGITLSQEEDPCPFPSDERCLLAPSARQPRYRLFPVSLLHHLSVRRLHIVALAVEAPFRRHHDQVTRHRRSHSFVASRYTTTKCKTASHHGLHTTSTCGSFPCFQTGFCNDYLPYTKRASALQNVARRAIPFRHVHPRPTSYAPRTADSPHVSHHHHLHLTNCTTIPDFTDA